MDEGCRGDGWSWYYEAIILLKITVKHGHDKTSSRLSADQKRNLG